MVRHHLLVLHGHCPRLVAVDAVVTGMALATALASRIHGGRDALVVEDPQGVDVRRRRLAKGQAGDGRPDLGEGVARVARVGDDLGRDCTVLDQEVPAVVAAEAAGEVQVTQVVRVGGRGHLHVGRGRQAVENLELGLGLVDRCGLRAGHGRVVERVEAAEVVDGRVRRRQVREDGPEELHRLTLDVGERRVDLAGAERGIGAHAGVGDRVPHPVVTGDAVDGPARLRGLDLGDVRPDVLGDPDLVLGDVLLDGPIGRGERDVVDLLGVGVGAPELDVREHVPMHALLDVSRVSRGGPDHQAHELARVVLVLGECGPSDEVDRGQARERVAALAGVRHRRELAVVRGWHGLRVQARDHFDQLLRAVELRLDPAVDPGLHVALAARDLPVRAGCVGSQLGTHLVAAPAEVGSLRPLDDGDARPDEVEPEGPAHEQEGEDSPARAWKPEAGAAREAAPQAAPRGWCGCLGRRRLFGRRQRGGRLDGGRLDGARLAAGRHGRGAWGARSGLAHVGDSVSR